MNEALKSVLKFGFKNLKLETIEAFTHNENVSLGVIAQTPVGCNPSYFERIISKSLNI